MSESLNSLRYSRQNTCKQKPFFLFHDRRSKKKHRENMRYLKSIIVSQQFLQVSNPKESKREENGTLLVKVYSDH